LEIISTSSLPAEGYIVTTKQQAPSRVEFQNRCRTSRETKLAAARLSSGKAAAILLVEQARFPNRGALK